MDANVKPKSNNEIELRNRTTNLNFEIQLRNRATKSNPKIEIEQRNAVQYIAINTIYDLHFGINTTQMSQQPSSLLTNGAKSCACKRWEGLESTKGWHAQFSTNSFVTLERECTFII